MIIRFYSVYFASKSWELDVIYEHEGDVTKEELSSKFQEATGEKANSIVIEEIYEEEYNLMIMEDHRKLEDIAQ